MLGRVAESIAPPEFHVNRFRQFTQGVGSSWLATLATVIYSLLSVPIALRYLSVDEFGLFVLLMQVIGYFALIEIGMSAATSRILVDYKDNPNNGNYGSIILTGSLVFSVQALLILAIGIPMAPWIIAFLGVPLPLTEVATFLLRWLTITSAAVIAFRIYSSILYANKRLDLIHAFHGSNMLVGLLLLAGILSTGGGLAGLAGLFLAQSMVAIILPALACYKLGLMPKKGCWGKPAMARFRELFAFGKDVFLVNVGNQVLEASQLIIVTRTMGLTAAAIWSVNTKLFGLVYQLVTKIEGTAIVFFAEMMVRGEREKLAARFRHVYQLTAGTAVVALAVMVAINHSFVSLWAKPSLAWPLPLSALIALCILLNAITRCSSDLIIHSKNIAGFRYVYFLEAAAFVTLALWLSARFGFYGVLVASLLCVIVFRATYTTWRVADYFKLTAKTLWWTWLKRPIFGGITILPFVISSSWLISNIPISLGQLLSALAWVGLPATITFLFIALPHELRQEFAQRWPKFPLIWKF